MERLTAKSKDGYHYPHCFREDTCGGEGYSSKCDKCEFAYKVCEKLGRLEDLQEQGRLLELESKYDKVAIGTEVFMVINQSLENGNICRVNEWWNDFDGFHGEYSALIPGQMGSYRFEYAEFGKTVFLTHEEAEEVLKRMVDGNGQV